MGSIQNPIGTGPRDPYDKLRVERVEEDKLTKDQKPKEPEELPPNERLGVAAFLLQMFQKMVDFFLASPSSAKSVQVDTRENLLLLKAALEILKKEDRSQDVDFLNQLSRIWRHALEDALYFKHDAVANLFKTLVRKIQHYPENQPHTFGYYLAENANQKWVPFPYMDLVQKIHREHLKNPPSSALTSWALLIDELVALLKAE